MNSINHCGVLLLCEHWEAGNLPVLLVRLVEQGDGIADCNTVSWIIWESTKIFSLTVNITYK